MKLCTRSRKLQKLLSTCINSLDDIGYYLLKHAYTLTNVGLAISLTVLPFIVSYNILSANKNICCLIIEIAHTVFLLYIIYQNNTTNIFIKYIKHVGVSTNIQKIFVYAYLKISASVTV